MNRQSLIDHRTTRAWTVDQAAHYWGVNPATYRNWESGRREPPSMIVRLAEAYMMLETFAPDLHRHLMPKAAVPRTGGRPRSVRMATEV